MNREKLEEWLKDISTPTGLSYSGDRTLSNSEVDTILEYVDNLQSKIDKAIILIDKYLEIVDNPDINMQCVKDILKEDK